MLKKLLSDFSIYGITPFIPKIASIFILPLITPFLTKVDYGVYGIITAYQSFMVLFYMLGLQVPLGNSFYKSKHQFKWLWRQLYGFLILWSLLYVILFALVLHFALPKEALDNKYTIILIYTIPTLLFGPTTQIAGLYYQLNRKVKETVIRNVLFGFISVFLILYFIRYEKMGYMGWIWSYFIVSILTQMSWIIPLLKKYKLTPIFNFKKKTVAKAVKLGLPIVPHLNALYILNQSDRIIMDIQKVSSSQIGLYNVAYTTAYLLEMIGEAFVKAVMPFVNSLLSQKKTKELKFIFYLSQIAFFIMLLLFSCVAKEIFQILIRNDELNGVYQLAVLIAMSTMFKPMYIAVNNQLFYYEKTKAISFYSLIAAGINIGLNLLLIPIWGINAAAFTTFLGYMFLTYSRFWTKEFKAINKENYQPLLWLILSILVCVIGYFLSAQNFYLRISAFISIIFISSFLSYKYRHIFTN